MTTSTVLMTLDDLKRRMQIPLEDTSKDDYLQVTLDDSIDFVKGHCKVSFAEGLPGAVKRAVVLLVKAVGESNVASQSLGDMSKSFFKGATFEQAIELLGPFIGYGDEDLSAYGGKKVKFIVASSHSKKHK